MTNRFESRRTTYWVLTGLTVNYWYLKRGHLPLPKLSRALFQSPLICVTWLPICDCEGPPSSKPYIEPQSTPQAARWSPAPALLPWRLAAPHQYGHQPAWTWVSESPVARAFLLRGGPFQSLRGTIVSTDPRGGSSPASFLSKRYSMHRRAY